MTSLFTCRDIASQILQFFRFWPIFQDTINRCCLEFFRVRLGWGNTHSKVSLILSLNNSEFLTFVLFTWEEEEENLKKKKTSEEKRMRLSLPNPFNLFPILYFFLLIVVIHFLVMF